jgi:hypothetical protein
VPSHVDRQKQTDWYWAVGVTGQTLSHAVERLEDPGPSLQTPKDMASWGPPTLSSVQTPFSAAIPIPAL